MDATPSYRKVTIIRAAGDREISKPQKLQKETFASRIADISQVMVRWRGRQVRRHSVS